MSVGMPDIWDDIWDGQPASETIGFSLRFKNSGRVITFLRHCGLQSEEMSEMDSKNILENVSLATVHGLFQNLPMISHHMHPCNAPASVLQTPYLNQDNPIHSYEASLKR